MTDRLTFTTRLDRDLVIALDESRLGTSRSRNWVIEQAVRAWLALQPGADDPIGPIETLTEDVQVAGEQPGPHRHRFPTERPNTRRGVAGMTYATFECDCGKTVERKVERVVR